MSLRFNSFVFFALVLFVSTATAQSVFSGVGKVVAVGDLHGDYEQYIQILKDNNLVNKRLKWAGGDVHFVQLGDVTDRGPDSLKIIRHLMKLEKQAKRAGGQVHVLIGNHEAMNVQTDLRYVHPGEYEALTNRQSPLRQAQYIEVVFRSMLAGNPVLAEQEEETRQKLKKHYPLGYVEHRMLWEPGQEMAKWYSKKNAVIQIDDTLYIHAGLDPHVEVYEDLETINNRVRQGLKKGGEPAYSVSERGPLWYRGLALNSREQEELALDRMLAHYGAVRMVVAHTTQHGVVMPRFDRKVVLADVGISAHYGGSRANVVVEDDRVFAVHRGELIELPLDQDIEGYLQATSALEPPGSKLLKFIEKRKMKASTGLDPVKTESPVK